MIMNIAKSLIVLCGLLFLVSCDRERTATGPTPRVHTQPLIITTASREHAYTIEVADTQPLRRQGLMFRHTMAHDHGMLFIYPRSQPVSMWMRNTYLGLDMVFIRDDGVVHHVHHQAEPLSEATISSRGPVRAVLELVAGEALRIGLRPGDRVSHPALTASN